MSAVISRKNRKSRRYASARQYRLSPYPYWPPNLNRPIFTFVLAHRRALFADSFAPAPDVRFPASFYRVAFGEVTAVHINTGNGNGSSAPRVLDEPPGRTTFRRETPAIFKSKNDRRSTVA